MHQQQRAGLDVPVCTSRQFLLFSGPNQGACDQKQSTDMAQHSRWNVTLRIQTDSVLNMKQNMSTETRSVAAYKEPRIRSLVQPIADISLWFKHHTVVYIKQLFYPLLYHLIELITFYSPPLPYNTLTHTHVFLKTHKQYFDSPACPAHVANYLWL